MKGKLANDPFWQAMGVSGVSSDSGFISSIDSNLTSVIKEIRILADKQYDETGKYAIKGDYVSDLEKHAKIESYANALMAHMKPKKVGEYPEKEE